MTEAGLTEGPAHNLTHAATAFRVSLQIRQDISSEPLHNLRDMGFFILMLWIKKSRLREVNEASQDHTDKGQD